MKAMVLAAGKGTRVQPLTYDIPKPMIPLVRKPVLESIIELLRSHEVDQIVINTSHLAPTLEAYFRDGAAWGVEIAYSFEGHIETGQIRAEALGSAGGMKRIQEFSGFFDDTFVVLCGDALIDLDITAAVALHKKKTGAGDDRDEGRSKGRGVQIRRGSDNAGRSHPALPGKAGSAGGGIDHHQHRDLYFRTGDI